MNASAAGLRFEEGNVIQGENVAQKEQNLEPADKGRMLLFQSIGNTHGTRLENYPCSI